MSGASIMVGAEGPFHRVRGEPATWRGELGAAGWESLAREVRQRAGRLVGLWGEDRIGGNALLHALYRIEPGYLWCSLAVPWSSAEFPSLAGVFPTASRQERAIYDLLGLRAQGGRDLRPWLRHQAWPDSCFPLRSTVIPEDILGCAGDAHYAFLLPVGEALHELPVGPVHAGSIEPGHFRFTCIGERIVKMEERLGYTHKGVEKLFEGRDILGGLKLVSRVSGDSSVGYAWAYCQAIETLAHHDVPPRATALRALCLERERIANHLGDIGAIGNDAGLAFALTQFLALKETLLRENEEVFGHRYLMDLVQPGGLAVDLSPPARDHLCCTASTLRTRLNALAPILREHGGLRDRLVNTGRITPERAAYWGMAGMCGRASGQAWDLRAQLAPPPYDRFPLDLVLADGGDVDARWTVRMEEIFTSLQWQETLLEALPAGESFAPLPPEPLEGEGLGIVEGWRGEIFVALRMEGGRLTRCHPHDPSWALWPVLEEAVLDDIVADFPLINKSFNLSYSGHDL